MNWLLIVVALLLLISTVIGYKKGLLKQGLILFGALILLWLMSFLLPYTREAIKEHTPVEIMISERVERMVQSRIDEMAEEKKDETLAQFNAYGNKSSKKPGSKVPALTKSQQTELIEKASIPAFVKKILLENNNSEIYDRLKVETFTDYVKAYVTNTAINILAYVTTFVLAYIIYRLLLAAVHLVDHLPLAGSLNHGLGAILGLAEGLVLLGVFFMILFLFCRTGAGKACYKCIDDSKILTFLYDYNPLMAIVSAVKG